MPGLLRTFAIAISLFAATTETRADVFLSFLPTHDMTCSAGVCSPTAISAVLNVGDLENLLASGNASVTTTGSGVQANNIVVQAALGWSSASTLELDAYDSIGINQPMSISGLAGLTLTNDSPNGTLSLGKRGNITFENTSSVLIINSVNYALVSTVKSLADAIAADPSGDFALAASYDAAGDGTYQFSPIQTTFVGSFEGLGNAISNLSIADHLNSDTVGLFATIGGGLVTNLRLEHMTLHAHGRDMYAGGLAGTMTGGLVANASVVSSKIVAQIGSRNGGLIGLNAGGSIANSFANVSVNGGEYVGGLVGQNSTGGETSTITDSAAHGAVNSTSRGYEFVGGLVGYNDYLGSITACYATGNVLGGPGSSAGGLVGINDGGNASNSYASGAVTGGSSSYVGGLVGTNSGGIDATYSTGPPSGGSGSLVGGFVGTDTPGDIVDSYWDTTTSGTSNGIGGGNEPGVTGLTTAQLQSGLPSGFSASIWSESASINDGLPYLLAIPPS